MVGEDRLRFNLRDISFIFEQIKIFYRKLYKYNYTSTTVYYEIIINHKYCINFLEQPSFVLTNIAPSPGTMYQCSPSSNGCTESD